MVREIKSPEEFTSTIGNSKLSVIDMYAEWCGPCKAIAPFVESLEKKFQDVQFAKVNVDTNAEIARAHSVTAMPTFLLFKAGRKVGEMKGANPQQLEMLVRQHAAPAVPIVNPPYVSAGFKNLHEFVDQSQLDCLNQKQEFSIKKMFKNESRLESDVDEQLLINISFNQNVKLHSIKFMADNLDNAPKTIKLFINRVSMGFDAVDSVEPTQVIELSKSDYEPNAATQLRFVKFQSVSTLSIFVEDNFGGEDITILKGLKLIGQEVGVTNMAELKKSE